MDPVEWEDERGVGGATVLVGGGLGHFVGVACHFLKLLLPSLALASSVAQHTGPGVLVGGAVCVCVCVCVTIIICSPSNW